MDGRARFREVVHAVNTKCGKSLPDYRDDEEIFWSLDDELKAQGHTVDVGLRLDGVRLVVVPGFLSECIAFIADCLTDGLAHLQSLGAQTSIAPMAGRGGSAENARRLKTHLDSLGPDDARHTILLPMSKGAADTLEMLALYPDVAERIDAVASLVGCVCGSPLKYHAPGWLQWIEKNLPVPTCARFGGDAVESLSPETRTAFLRDFQMPPTVKAYSIGAVAGRDNMSRGMMASYRALCGYDVLNDGQMLLRDQILPNATFLGALNCDHIASAMPFNRNTSMLGRFVTGQFLNHNAFPREVMLEAVVRYVLEDLSA